VDADVRWLAAIPVETDVAGAAIVDDTASLVDHAAEPLAAERLNSDVDRYCRADVRARENSEKNRKTYG
jgi:hypothetical protein